MITERLRISITGRLAVVTRDGVSFFVIETEDGLIPVVSDGEKTRQKLLALIGKPMITIRGEGPVEVRESGNVPISVTAKEVYEVDRRHGWKDRFLKTMEEFFGD